jgi:hypothetical protein
VIASLFQHRYRVAILVLAAIVCASVLQGCTALGLQQPKTFRDDYAYAITQVTAVRDTATTLLERRQISIKDAEYVLETSRQSRAYLDTAKQVYEAGQTLEGKTQLELATSILTQLETFLTSRASR